MFASWCFKASQCRELHSNLFLMICKVVRDEDPSILNPLPVHLDVSIPFA